MVLTKNIKSAGLWLVLIAMAAAAPHLFRLVSPSEPPALAYPRGPWWRADINQVMIGAAHILISHEYAAAKELDMIVPGSGNKRSEQAALELAQELAEELADDPARFGELARKYSDDPTSAPWGGRLGNVFVRTLPPRLVDALGNVPVGQVSSVVETTLGFHIVTQYPLPAEELLSGKEVRIQYVGTAALPAPGRVASRSREEAFELAHSAQQALSAGKVTFDEAVERWSDGPERAQHGALGTRSSYDGFDPVGSWVLSQLPEGQWALLDDGARGLRILQRIAVDQTRIASRDWLVGYKLDPAPDWTDPSISRSKQDAHDVALALAQRSQSPDAPLRDADQRDCDYGICADRDVSRFVGAGSFIGVDAAIAALPVGGVLKEPIDVGYGWLVSQRTEAEPHRPLASQVTVALPRPPPVELEQVSVDELAGFAAAFREAATAQLQLKEDEQALLDQVLKDALARFESARGEDRIAELKVTREQLQEALGQSRSRDMEKVFDKLVQLYQGRTI